MKLISKNVNINNLFAFKVLRMCRDIDDLNHGMCARKG